MYEDLDLFSPGGDPAPTGTVRVLYVDTETTGTDPSAEICEIGALLVVYEGRMLTGSTLSTFQSLVKPSEPIPPEASAVHHITNRMVEDEPPVEALEKDLAALTDPADFVCAHNAPFDMGMLRRQLPALFRRFQDERVVDSLRLSRHVWPELPTHNLQALRYRFALDEGLPGEAHRALFDAMLVQRLVEHAWVRTQVEAGAWEELSAFSRAPLDVQTFSFGKYRGSLVEDIAAQDPPYIKWLLAQVWLPADYPDLYHTLLRKLPGG